MLKQKTVISVEEFSEILNDMTDHFGLLKPNDMESCAFYLYESLIKANLLNGSDQNEYLRAIHDFLHERFPGYYSLLLLDYLAA
jgi:hypothetical protein